MGYRAYSQYQESGLDVFGRIPSHWETHRLNDIAELITSNVDKKSLDDQEIVRLCNYVDVYKNKEINNSLEFMIATASNAEIKKFRLQPSDVIITKDSESPHDIGVPALVTESAEDLLCSYHLTIIRPQETISGSFLYYSLQALTGAYQFTSAANGVTRFGLTSIGTKNVRICIPVLVEQIKIAEFLDHKTVQIDRLIEKKQELIEKLHEQRISIITMAVTRGVNAQALAGPCTQDWLGGVPKHWKNNYKLNFLSTDDRNSFVNGPFGSDLLTTELVDEGVPVIYSGDVKETGFQRKSDKYVTEEKAKQLVFCRVDGGDILLAKVGDPPGDACVYPIGQPSGIVTQDVVRIKVDKRTIDAEYLCFLLNSEYGRHLVRLVSVEATRGRFSLADLKSIRHILPPLEEQEEIVLHIHQQMKRCNRLSDLAIREIEALQEYRTALITAAVTGQIDVRDWQAPEVFEQSAQDKEVA
ncbi:type I restriction-modification system subunit S [Pseudomonas sp. BAY1663]|uniref:restriction endonuclease subunit S n=1 Tax=Pseudomonas sp. BAY1663 TaxID=1439940 RepID=UPI00042DE9E3|nr:restriction endonuclease subunit S [Pseudomonas sp. BAY1663]EXF43462.1 type I restriction-modification system subunit S [Pseudomonas sp. BAY1663]